MAKIKGMFNGFWRYRYLLWNLVSRDFKLKYRRSVTLEPMNAYERHVIHAALQDMSGVTTYSIGTEPNRRVVVAFDRGEKR